MSMTRRIQRPDAFYGTRSLLLLASLLASRQATAIHNNTNTTLEPLDPSAYDYFDRLRFQPGLFVERSPQSSILRVTTSSSSSSSGNEDDDDEKISYRLAEFKCFLPFSNNGKKLRSRALDDAFTVLLAIDHFNHRDRDPGIFDFMDYDDCDIRLTAELIDTQFDPVATAHSYVNRLPQSENETTIQNPPISAVVGAWRSAVSAPLAILSGVSATPQVSSSSTAVDFDDKDQYPYFGRTLSSTFGEAQVALRFFQSIGSSHVAILYLTDQFGSSLQKSFSDAATSVGITTTSIGISYDLTIGGEEVRRAMETLAGIQYRHVYCIIFETQLEAIANAAKDFGLVGADFLYAIHGPDAGDLRWATDNGEIDFSNETIEFLDGAGIIQPIGGLERSDCDEIMLESDMGYHSLSTAWQEKWNDHDFWNYISSKLPTSLEHIPGFDREYAAYSQDPGTYRPFLYDAVFGLGVSMCRAGKQNNTFFDGPSVMEQFRSLNATGASGQVLINNVTGTREYQSVTFVVWNSYNDPDKGLQFRPSSRLIDGDFVQLPGSEFRFASGRLEPPPALPPLQENLNYIGLSGRILGYGLTGLTISISFLCVMWIHMNRTSRVIYAAQPLFLILMAIGSVVSISSLIPLSVEEDVLSSTAGLDFACMASPWLYVVGSNITLSALISKTTKVYQAYCDPSMEYIQVNFSDIVKVLFSLLSGSCSVLILWTILAPLEWNRIYRGNTDIFLRLTDSYGECRGDSGKSAAFAAVLVSANFLILGIGTLQAAITRHVETEYKESQYINLSLFSILQAWMMGIAILSVTHDDPQARFYVMCGIIFVTSVCSLAFVYVPKYLALRDDIRTRGENAYLELRNESGKLKPPGDGDPDERQYSAVENQGMARTSIESSELRGPSNLGSRVLHNPKSMRNLMATGGRDLSRRQLCEINKSQMSLNPDSMSHGSSRGILVNSMTRIRRDTSKTHDGQYLDDSVDSFALPSVEALPAVDPNHHRAPSTVYEVEEEFTTSREDDPINIQFTGQNLVSVDEKSSEDNEDEQCELDGFVIDVARYAEAAKNVDNEHDVFSDSREHGERQHPTIRSSETSAISNELHPVTNVTEAGQLVERNICLERPEILDMLMTKDSVKADNDYLKPTHPHGIASRANTQNGDANFDGQSSIKKAS